MVTEELNEVLKAAFKDEAETVKMMKFNPSRRFLRKRHEMFDKWLLDKQWVTKRLMKLRCVTCRVIELAFIWYKRSPKVFIQFLELMEEFGQEYGVDSFVKHEVNWAFLSALCDEIIEKQRVETDTSTKHGNLTIEREIINGYNMETPLKSYPNIRPDSGVPGHDVRTLVYHIIHLGQSQVILI